MKITYLIASALYCVCLINSAHADDVAINIGGTIVDNTCIVSLQSQDVKLGNVAANQFQKAGDMSPVQPFTISLEKCSSSVSNTTVTFSGNPDVTNPNLLAVDAGANTASGLGVAIYDKSQTLLPLGQASTQYDLNGQSSATLQFFARYMATQSNVASGDATATATFVVNYA
ncbi:fimbrial protein [Buttiauxella sp. B2]|uniref:fimbrial protein n=1 Tax=Buttiauxella sp. B2 TaxID=2587812 RepID=UPI0011225770|nr:fimbrial protein [Buttiauxella sp. B2]TNV20491.1 fimbrial protein [Buttiauxella sp. B2]